MNGVDSANCSIRLFHYQKYLTSSSNSSEQLSVRLFYSSRYHSRLALAQLRARSKKLRSSSNSWEDRKNNGFLQSVNPSRLCRKSRPGPEVPMQIRHVCQSCGKLLAVCEHANYTDLKRCWQSIKALCPECAGWPESAQARESAGRATRTMSTLRGALNGPGRMK